MLFLKKRKDGGIESTVTGYWLIEIKKLFSILLLKFEGKSREAFHTHAFNCVSIVLFGKLTENMLDGSINTYTIKNGFFFTYRDTFHKVDSDGTTLILNIRGPWIDKWKEYLPNIGKYATLTHGRKILEYYD